MYHHRVIACLFALLALVGHICAQEPLQDLVHHGDVVDVDVVGGFDFDWRGTLTPEGTLVGLGGFGEPVNALCRKEADIAKDVQKLYGSILRDPEVVVKIVDRSKRALVRVEGGVKTPTRFSIQRAVRLRELIVLAGGFTDTASGEIVIFRQPGLSCAFQNEAQVNSAGPPRDNVPPTTHIKISDLLAGHAAADPQIYSGDIITVTRAEPVYVIGAVNNPRPIYAHTPMSISRAIASAGGLSRDADESKVTIYRRDGTSSRVINADLAKIRSGEAVDELLKQFDILEVVSKGGGRRTYPPVVVSGENTDNVKAELPLRVIDNRDH